MSIALTYIIGYGRSGSTLIESKLGEKLACTGLGEIIYLWDRGVLANETCGCRKPFAECEFWQAVLAHGFGKVTDSDAREYTRLFHKGRLDKPGLRPFHISASDSTAFRNLARTLYKSIATIAPDGEMLIDSSKQPIFGLWLQEIAGFDMKYLHVVRDPRAVTNSWMARKLRTESTAPGEEMARSRFTLGPIWRWRYINGLSDEVRSRTRADFLTVVYEEFCADPDATIAEIASTLSAREKRDAPPHVWHSVSGNPDRFSERYDDIRVDERWKKNLAPWQVGLIEATCQRKYLAYTAR